MAAALRTTLSLCDTGRELMRQNFRRSHPEASEQELQGLLRAWLADRPGAKDGDSPGRPIDVSTRFR